MTDFLLCFVPLFVAVDPIGILPMYMNLTRGVEKNRLRRLLAQSIATALIVALGFLAIGKLVLYYLGISIADFMVAGGLLLFVLALSDLLTSEKRQRRVDPDSLGPVPIGVPLIVGPAVLTTGMLLMDQYGKLTAMSATAANVLLAGLVFAASGFFHRLLGRTGAQIVSKLASLLMAAIAVMMVRKGVSAFVAGP
jgi:multiple antibiotic resistance protein